ncbi:MAG: hypothetical protein NZZ41_04595 [Candidatus Dojkabacteria bacterium]|nr:hypothetical protein [Candidatus Dojkabacteria bacterium]
MTTHQHCNFTHCEEVIFEGDIFYAKYGNPTTNIKFFKVVHVTNNENIYNENIEVIEIGKDILEKVEKGHAVKYIQSYKYYVKPNPNKIIGERFKVTIIPKNKRPILSKQCPQFFVGQDSCHGDIYAYFFVSHTPYHSDVYTHRNNDSYIWRCILNSREPFTD